MPNHDTNVNTQNTDFEQVTELPELIHPFCLYEKKLNLTGTHKGQKNAFQYLSRMGSATKAFGCMDTPHPHEAKKHNVSTKTISNWESMLSNFGLIKVAYTGRASERVVTETGFQFLAWQLGHEEFVGYHRKKEVLITSPQKSCSDRSSDRLIDKQSSIPYTETEISNNEIELCLDVESRAVDNEITVEKILNTLSLSYNLTEIDKLSFRRFVELHSFLPWDISYAWGTFVAYSADNAVSKPLGLLVEYLKRSETFGAMYGALTEEFYH